MKTALITGASSGIGKEYALRFAKKGYDIIAIARREKLLKELCLEIEKKTKRKASYIIAELTDEKDLIKIEKKIRENPNIEVLVNNAGFTTKGLFHKETIGSQDNIAKVHVIATTRLTHAVIPNMIKKKRGIIINVSSIASFLVGPGSAMYCATKSFVASFSESLYLELKPFGIKVQALCPGYTLTDFHKKLGYDISKPRFKKFMTSADVVNYSLSNIDKPICVPGLKYKLIKLLPKFVPRKLFYKIAMMRFKGK